MKKYDYPVVILAGGLGTRLREETEFRPKPMVPIGGKPIIWHIMKLYAHYGFYRFIICLGYKGMMIKDYFLNYHLSDIDLTLNTKTGSIIEHQRVFDDWEVTLVDTGMNSMTGSRIAQIARYINTEKFLVTYGDGLADINMHDLMSFHTKHKKIATLTGITMNSRFGNLVIENDKVTTFAEKQTNSTEWINGGFFIFEKSFLNYLSVDADCVLEHQPLKNVSQDGHLMVYKHTGFWQCMDTYREHQLLEDYWEAGAPWKLWKDNIEKEFTPAHIIKQESIHQPSF